MIFNWNVFILFFYEIVKVVAVQFSAQFDAKIRQKSFKDMHSKTFFTAVIYDLLQKISTPFTGLCRFLAFTVFKKIRKKCYSLTNTSAYFVEAKIYGNKMFYCIGSL